MVCSLCGLRFLVGHKRRRFNLALVLTMQAVYRQAATFADRFRFEECVRNRRCYLVKQFLLITCLQFIKILGVECPSSIIEYEINAHIIFELQFRAFLIVLAIQRSDQASIKTLEKMYLISGCLIYFNKTYQLAFQLAHLPEQGL